ncbi:restriction endonuclease subunit S [Stenotrophomonas pigmentata]|uniref:restriction endonuclease subunit S n=1 Tax=Stenotrophomonas pigmentata TaxID=3055080 RepID=UPI0026EB9CD2|nr:restriction endonuclease subunit S [Stenotrophomonas sp. 610A2]
MSELPHGWVEISIGELAEVTAGGTPRANDAANFAYPGAGISWITPADLSGYNSKFISTGARDLTLRGYESCSAKLIPEGSILFSSRAPIGYVAIAENELCTSQGFKNFTFPDGIDPNYAFYYLKSIKAVAEELGTGTTFKEISAAKAKILPFRLAPTEEQIVIAKKLDELTEQKERIESRIKSIPKTIEELRQSIIADAVSGLLTEDWRANNPFIGSVAKQVEAIEEKKHGKLKVRNRDFSCQPEDLYEVPESWEWIANHRLAEDSSTAICAGPFGTIFKAKDFRPEGIPIIFLRHVGEGIYKTEKPNFMDEAVWKELHQDYSVHGGELLVTKLGDPPGTACIYPKGIGVAMVTPDVIKMNVDERLAVPAYLSYFFNSERCKELIGKMAFGATRLRIDIPMFKGFPIPLPPLNEQIEIVQRVESALRIADGISLKVGAARTYIEGLSQSIFEKAFNGELTAGWRADNPELISGEKSVNALLQSIKNNHENAVQSLIKRKNKIQKGAASPMTKVIISVTEALAAADIALNGQQLMEAAGYPNDCTTEQLEIFFLDVRAALDQGAIIKISRDEDHQDWFALNNKVEGKQ